MTAKRALTVRPLPFFTLSTAVNMQVVNAPPGNAAQRDKRSRVCVKQHLVPLAGIGHQPEGPAGAQQHARNLHAPINAAHHHAFFAPVKLECLAQVEPQRHEGFDIFASIGPPGPNEVGDAAVAAHVAAGFDL